MKKSTVSALLFALFVTGCAVGYVFSDSAEAQPCDCNLAESRAIKGCEFAAIQIHNQLEECEWKLQRTVEAVEEYCEKLSKQSQSRE